MSDKYPHIFLKNYEQAEKFTSSGAPIKRKIPSRPADHGERLQVRWDSLWQAAEQERVARTAVSLPTRDGVYIEFMGAPDSILKTESLEDLRQGIRLMNVRTKEAPGLEKQKITLATVFIPKTKEIHFLNKLNAFKSETTGKGKPKHDELMRSIEDLRLAVLDSFWQDDPHLIPQDSQSVWCEVWLLDSDQNAESEFQNLAAILQVATSENALYFPERTVLLVKANRLDLLNIIQSSSHIAEFRRAKESADFFVSMDNKEQAEWVEALRKQLVIDSSPKVSVCILDTGANNGHGLLAPILQAADCQTVDPNWGASDHHGHGTGMCGLAAYGDLTDILPQPGPIILRHCLESVKILPPSGNNLTELYGFVTTQGISRAEIQAPDRVRIGCMAVASEDGRDKGSPSSWSAAIDQLTSGADDGRQRLFFVSAGNMESPTDLINYPESNITYSIHDPGQSWNALTVGAITEKCVIHDSTFHGYTPLAQPQELSPFSSTSSLWEPKWPIKPEIVFEGGNTAMDLSGTICDHEDLSLLTTGHQPTRRQLVPFSATSASTALAARMAAQIQAEYPEAWPETVRGLMVHSANWPDAIIRQFHNKNYTKTDYVRLLRYCGYGVPNLDKARACMANSLTLISEAEIQPYSRKEGRYVTNDMHLYTLPWPKSELEALGEQSVSVRVTLSYFIEPGPGEVGWKNRYRYASHGLRFALNAPHEAPDDFRKRVNVAVREDDEKIDRGGESNRWDIGQGRNVGSIHSDIWEGTAVEVAACNLVAIYPIIGWWRERHHLGRWNHKARYSLIISIRAPETDVDIYTPVATQIGVPISIMS